MQDPITTIDLATQWFTRRRGDAVGGDPSRPGGR